MKYRKLMIKKTQYLVQLWYPCNDYDFQFFIYLEEKINVLHG